MGNERTLPTFQIRPVRPTHTSVREFCSTCTAPDPRKLPREWGAVEIVIRKINLTFTLLLCRGCFLEAVNGFAGALEILESEP